MRDAGGETLNGPTRILIVDDTAIFRRVVTQALLDAPGVEVAGTASNGRLALARMSAVHPDLLTLDLEMPEMSGIELLEALGHYADRPGVIVLSSQTTRGAQLTLRALELGAFDFITKPEGGSVEENIAALRARLLPMVKAFVRKREIREILRPGPAREATAAPPEAIEPRPRRTGRPFVLIAVSTGGPAALSKLIPQLPPNLGVPVLIVQHMPPLFTGPLAASLALKSQLPVTEAVDAEGALPDHVYIAPGGKQMKVVPGKSGELVIRITDDPPEQNYKPCADYLFRSAALNFPGNAIAVILTGMGSDGTHGLKMLKRGGCFAIAQDEASCVVFGMPKEAIATGVVDAVVPLDQVASAIIRSIRDVRP